MVFLDIQKAVRCYPEIRKALRIYTSHWFNLAWLWSPQMWQKHRILPETKFKVSNPKQSQLPKSSWALASLGMLGSTQLACLTCAWKGTFLTVWAPGLAHTTTAELLGEVHRQRVHALPSGTDKSITGPFLFWDHWRIRWSRDKAWSHVRTKTQTDFSSHNKMNHKAGIRTCHSE